MAPKKKYQSEAEKKAARAERERQRRSNETPAQRSSRVQGNSDCQRKRHLNESSKNREERLDKMRRYTQNHDILITAQKERRKRLQRTRLQLLAESISENESNITEHYCGLMDARCESCNSKNFEGERPPDKKFTQCCQKGKVDIPKPNPQNNFPALLENLMNGRDENHSKNFMEHIRSINSSFAFASMSANCKPPPGYGPYCYRIQGQVYHFTGTLHPNEGKKPTFSQLYILDPSEATNERLAIDSNKGCNKDLMAKIAIEINQISPFAKAYKMLGDMEKEAQAHAVQNGLEMPKIVMAITQNPNSDIRRYNNPRVNEVAIIFEDKDGEPPFERDILVYPKSDPNNPRAQETQKVHILDPNLDPMTYPMFFPHGNKGWSVHMKQNPNSDKRLSMLQYYSYMLSVRDDFNPILNGGKLTQQFCVDAYVKIESNRLNYIRVNQKNLMTECYKGLDDQLNSRAQRDGKARGKTIILPSSFDGSERNMQQRYQDAMAIVAKYGKPDLFITMTCNPKWKEITENLESWQKREYRPDLVARVFNLKLKSLLEDINNGLFGTVKAMIHVIEFQKRGLPHAHILLILNQESKIREEKDVDAIVWAEIPDKEKYPVLHDIVTRNMIHTPCGIQNPKSPCMDGDKCTKGFPKDFRDNTMLETDGYPKYKRRQGPKINNIDNSWVVPYNPYLLKKYNCHINVEVCASVKSVKYLFKYVYKGHDCANVDINITSTDHDEVKDHVNARYVSSPEAMWRILTFPMHHQSHSIIRLAIHLPNEQQICFDDKDDEETLRQKMTKKKSTLMAWFELNKENQEARNFLYREIPEHFVFEGKSSKWKPRKIGGSKIIGRMYFVSATDGERYFLRLLLMHVKGATDYKDLRTVDGIEYSTFKETAEAAGLLLDDRVWKSMEWN